MIKMLNRIGRLETGDIHTPRNRAKAADGVCRAIGVVGLGPRNGTTHVAIAMANFLADVKGFEVCLAEKSDHSDMEKLPELMKGGRERGTGPVKINGVTYLTSGFAYDRSILNNGKFDCIVYDLGSDIKRAELTLMNCDTEIAVGSAAPWRAEEYLSLTRPEGAKDNTRKRMILINPADARAMRTITAGTIRLPPFTRRVVSLKNGKLSSACFQHRIQDEGARKTKLRLFHVL